MSHETPEYFRLPNGTYSVDTGVGRTIFADPALLTTYQLAALSDALAGERQSCADEPATPLGYWPTAVAALLGHVEVLAGRVKRQQDELAEQEVNKLRVVQEWKLAESTIERATKQLEGFDGVRSELELLGCSHDGFPSVIDAQLHDLWKNTAPLCELETMQRGHEAYRAVVKQHLRQILALDGSRLDEVPMLILEAARQLSHTLR